MDVTESPDAEVAEGDAREGHGASLGPVVVGDEVLHDLEAVEVVAGRQDAVEDEQLAERVGDVAQLGDQE